MQPYNFSIGGNLPDPSQAFTSGMQQGNAVLQLDRQQQQQALELQAQQQALRAQEQYTTAVQGVLSKPSAEGYARLMTLRPKEAEGMTKAWAALSAEKQQSGLSDLTQWTAAVENGRPDLAITAMNARADMIDRDAGGKSAEGEALRAQAKILEADPTTGARLVLAPMLYAHPDGKRALDNIRIQADEQRAAAKAPAELRTANAGASKAEADATTAGVTAEFAKPMAASALEKAGADLGLTRAQITQAGALTSKYRAETQKAILDAATGDPSKSFDAEAKLRKEYTDGTKGFTEVADAFRRVKSSQDNAVGDLSLIFGYMKMLDPASVVREGEFASAQNAAGIDDKVRNIYNKIASGERLTAGQRKAFIGQAGVLFKSAEKREGEVREGITKVAKNYRLNTDNIFGGKASEPVDDAPPKPEPPKPGKPKPIVVDW